MKTVETRNSNLRKNALAFLLIFFALGAEAQQLPFITWNTAEGLAQSQVRCLHQDHLGYLWIGTLGGVSRFNGRDFDNFSRKDGLHGNQVNCIAEVGDTAIVFGSLGGITFYDGHQFKSVRFPAEIGNAQVNDFYADKTALWIATERGILVYKDSLQIALDAGILDDPHVKRIFEQDGNQFIVTKSSTYQLSPDSLFKIIDQSQVNGVVMDGAPDGKGGIYLATVGQGLLHFKGGVKTQWLPEDGLISENITGVSVGQNQELLIKSRDGFMRISADGRMDTFRENDGLSTADVRALVQDREGDIWIGTNGAGISKFSGDGVVHFSSKDGMSGNIVMSILEENDSTLWYSTYDNGITRISGTTTSTFGIEDGLRSTRVWCSEIDTSGAIWFGTSGGLSRFDQGEFVTYGKESGLPHKQIISLLSESNGTLWVGTARGLVRYMPETNKFIRVEPIPALKIRSILRGEDGVLWLATTNGIYAFDGIEIIHFSEAEGLPDNSVFCLARDQDNHVWAGTESGLCRINSDKTITPVELEGGFGANHINFILMDDDAAWLGTNDGLFYSSNILVDLPSWRHLGKHDGVIYLETNQNSAFISENKLRFGTSEALTRIDLDLFRKSSENEQLNIHLSELRINLEAPDWDKLKVQNHQYGTWPQNLTVPYTDNHFTFFFDALNLHHPERIRYQYMLKGIDEEWEPITETNFATYSQLPYQDYTFMVRAVDETGQTSDPATIDFTVENPFWLSWWFIALEVIAVGALIWFIFNHRRKLLIEKLEKEKLEFKSRMLSLEQQTLNSSMNRHFIFNALNSIQYYINRQDRLSANRYLSSFAKLIRKNLDSSQVNFTSLREEVERLELYLELEHMRFKDKFDYAINIEDNVDQESIKVPAMLLQPFLENSIWHGILPMEHPGHIAVNIGMQGSDVVAFTITDNGIGIETSQKNKMDSEDHISQGMNITSGRIELIRKMTGKNVELIGPYEIKNAEQVVQGTQVKIILPADFQGVFTN
ncbi:MAG: ligand-binding sensor domain-containing protein [Flavobacteriales bacterium]|jgi:ligand-binding sensor domain-containing protein